ncbi:phage tail protein [Citrobacter youngae]|uniref:phage tail-collar fiber domain-containing protein n=2 Tax=Enterobacteriaceae TaxID=543 RepID=UPI0013FD8FE4|nr:phage tail protein [Citrobacter youngae]NHM10720.1 phage tail protein [Citrobacter youngae]
MSTKFKTIITTAGAEKLAAATVPGGKKVNITVMAVGDGGGKLPVPDAGQVQLVNEVWRHALNKISQDNRNSNYIVAELVIPPEVGGFWMRELGLYDDEGTLIAVANMAESYKPELAEGSGRAQTCRMVIIVSSIASVELSIDSTMVMATQEYVDDRIAEHEKSRRHPDATLKEKGFTQLSSATDSASEVLAATPKAVKAAYDLANAKYTAQDASTAQKGIVRLSSAADSTSEAEAATPKAVKIAMDNANARLAKDRNGADIPNPPLFVQNIGLKPTVDKAANAVDKNGDTMTGNLTLKGDYRLSFIIQNEDGSIRAYIFKDKGGDGIRISNGDDGGGDFVFGKNGQFYCPDIMHVGNTIVWGDGNIEGARWGGLLSDWLTAQLVARDNNINLRAPYEWVNQNFVNRAQRGAQASMTMDGGLVEAPWGCFLTGGNGNEGNQVGVALYRPLQILRNNTWVTIEN